MCFTTYAVYKQGEIQAAGSLLNCWNYLLTVYGEQISRNPLTGIASRSVAADLADAGIHIAPVGDHQKGQHSAPAA